MSVRHHLSGFRAPDVSMGMRGRVFLGMVLATAVACGDDAPKPPAGPTGPWADNGLTVSRVEITGPASIPQGQSAQYSVLARMSDGSARVPKSVKWFSTQLALFQVSASGLVTATQVRGEAALQVEVAVQGGKAPTRGGREILVMPDGTFRLVGTVTEADSTGVPIGGVRVEARAEEDGPLATFATTGPDGRYKLYGVPGDSHLRVWKDGYVAASDRLRLGAHETRNIQLRVDGGRASIAGDYTMTVDAGASGCYTRALPEELRRRTYEATVTQDGPRLEIRLTSPAFMLDAQGRGNRFNGVASSTQARLTMVDFGWPYYSPTAPTHPDIAERLPDGTTLVLAGTADLSQTGGGWSGTMLGYLSQYDGGNFPNVRFLSGCPAIRVTLSRR
jgi:hypothetical protein